MRMRRLAALVLALLVAGAGVSPCTAAVLARAGDAAPAQDPHAMHADPQHAGHAEQVRAGSGAHEPGDCHAPRAWLSPRCQCGCTGDVPRAAASSFAAPWALPAPSLASVEGGGAPTTPSPPERPPQHAASRIDHVPIAA